MLVSQGFIDATRWGMYSTMAADFAMHAGSHLKLTAKELVSHSMQSVLARLKAQSGGHASEQVRLLCCSSTLIKQAFLAE